MKIICLSKCQVNNGKPSSMLITLYPYTSSYILEQNVIPQESKNWPKLQARKCVEGSRQLYFQLELPELLIFRITGNMHGKIVTICFGRTTSL